MFFNLCAQKAQFLNLIEIVKHNVTREGNKLQIVQSKKQLYRQKFQNMLNV